MNYELASSSWDTKEIEQIMKVIDSDMFTMGKYVRDYEEKFSRYFGSKYSVMVNSGSSANLLMIAALFYRKENPLKCGNEVIVPAVSWSTTYSPLCQYGLKIKFVDIDIETLNYDLNKLEDAITDETRLIVVVNLLGNPNNFDEINKIINGKTIDIVEDNCESMGAEYHGKKTGTIGLMGSFSTFFSHHMSTMEGGVVVTDDEELYDILLCIRSHGWTRHLPKENVICNKMDDQFVESFRFILPGYNVRPIEMMGAIGISQLEKLPSFIDERRKNAKFFVETFKNDDRFIIQREIGKSSWFGFSMIIKDKNLNRKTVIDTLRMNKIDTRPIVSGNFANKEVVKYFDYVKSDTLEKSDVVDNFGFFVGNHQFDITDKITYLKETLDTL